MKLFDFLFPKPHPLGEACLTHTYDAKYGFERAVSLDKKTYGHVLFCKCGAWKYFPTGSLVPQDLQDLRH